MTALDQFVADLASRLHVGRREHTRIVQEVRDHLDDAVAVQERRGAPREAAVRSALAAFGSPVVLAREFNVGYGTRAMRKAPFIVLGGGAAVGGGFVLAAATQPSAASPHTATIAAQVLFFAAVFAFQVALVAGVSSVSRVMASWKAPGVRAESRAFVRRCSILSIAALAVAALGWLSTIALAWHVLHNPNEVTFALGATIMIGGAFAAAVMIARLEVNRSDDVPEPTPTPAPLLGLGEQAIAVIRRHPATSCAVAAVAAGVSAMMHAETTVVGALPWGVSEAAGVVLCYLVLGPVLGLRRTRVA